MVLFTVAKTSFPVMTAWICVVRGGEGLVLLLTTSVGILNLSDHLISFAIVQKLGEDGRRPEARSLSCRCLIR
jgi:hypothetical protein